MSQSPKYKYITELNLEAYQKLIKGAQETSTVYESTDGPNWYMLTYDLFKTAPLNTFNDFLRIIAYTYSWMPTIPTIKAHYVKDRDGLIENLNLLKNGNVDLLPDLLYQLIPIINNSLIGVSKVLHFIAPDHVPIIDRNVLSGWAVFFSMEYPMMDILKLPYYKTALNQRHISKYLEYRNTLIQWAANCDGSVTMRDLEFAFFHLGRNVTPGHFKVYQPAL